MTSQLGRVARIAAIAGMTMAAFGTTTAANAASTDAAAVKQGCPSNGHLSRGYSCTSLSNGNLFHRKYTTNKASTWYDKTGGGATTIQLGYNAGSGNKYAGKVSISSGQTKSAAWSGIDYCKSSLGLLISGSTYQTPPTHCNT